MNTNDIEKMRRIVCAELNKMPEISSDNTHDSFTYEFYADYRDIIQPTTVSKILEVEDCLGNFMETVMERYQEEEWNILGDIKGRIEEIIVADDSAYPNGLTDEENELLQDLVGEMVSFDYPFDHYLKQEFHVPIMVDTGDGNYDFVLNSVYPCYCGEYDKEPSDAASIVWLANQQGYSKKELWDVLRKDVPEHPHGFLESMASEVANISSHMNTLVFLTTMTLEDLIKLNELIKIQDKNGKNYDARENPNCGYVEIQRKTISGLFDFWNGGGSTLEIELEKDVILPIKFIYSAAPDRTRHIGYGIDDVYGLCGSAWSGKIKIYKSENI